MLKFFSLEWNRLQRTISPDAGRNQHDLANGTAIFDAGVCIVFRIGRCFGSSYVVGRFVCIVGRIDVCSKCIPFDLSAKCIRNGNYMGDESGHLCRRYFINRYGPNYSVYLWIMVCFKKNIRKNGISQLNIK